MTIVGIGQDPASVLRSPNVRRRRLVARSVAVAASAALLMTVAIPADAAIVPTVGLGTSAQYVVLGAETVTNTGASRLYGNLGVSPGTAITGFPPGLVIVPGVTNTTNEAAAQAQADLTTAYLNAKNRPLDSTTTAQLGGLNLKAGVHAGPDKSPLGVTGTLILDGENDPNSVFIFQTDSTLTTASSSRIVLINGARECNVFWQVGSSATLGTDSYFIGTILALTSVAVTTRVTIHGRALATTGEVTLDTDTFTLPTCADTTGPTTTTGGPGGPATTVPEGGTSTTTPGGGTGGTSTTSPGGTGGTATTTPGGTATTTPGSGVLARRILTPAGAPVEGPGVPGVVGPPRTGASPAPTEAIPWPTVLVVTLFGLAATVRTSALAAPRSER